MFGFLFFSIFTFGRESNESKSSNNNGKIKVESYSKYEKQYYEDISKKMSALGFENIECVELNEKPGLFKKPGTIKEIIIDGNNEFKKGTLYSKDAMVTIFYYPEE